MLIGGDFNENSSCTQAYSGYRDLKIACYKEKLIKPAMRVIILEFNDAILIRISILNSGRCVDFCYGSFYKTVVRKH